MPDAAEVNVEDPEPAIAGKNGVLELIAISVAGSIIGAICVLIFMEALASPYSGPVDYFLLSPEEVVMAFAFYIAAPLTSILSLCTLRRALLIPSTFVVGGATLVFIGVLIGLSPVVGPLISGPIGVVLVFVVMTNVMLFCRKSFPIGSTDSVHRDNSLRTVPQPLRRLIWVSCLCVFAAYAAWAGRPNYNARLVRAVAANDLSAVEEALDAGADANYNPYFPKRPTALGSPITTAILNGHSEMVHFLVEQGVSLNEYSYQEDQTPLMSAAYTGDLDLVRYLIQHGARDVYSDNDDNGAYEIAVDKGHVEIAFLLELLEGRESD